MSDLEKVIDALEKALPSGDATLEKAREILERSQFRAPENQEKSWVNMAQLIQSLPTIILAKVLFIQSSEISFTEKEKMQIRSALTERRVKIEQFIKSPKLTEAEREAAVEWLENTDSAYEKIEE